MAWRGAPVDRVNGLASTPGRVELARREELWPLDVRPRRFRTRRQTQRDGHLLRWPSLTRGASAVAQLGELSFEPVPLNMEFSLPPRKPAPTMMAIAIS